MKRRLGFVSNSSSSSFVVIISEEGHQSALEKLNAYQRAVAESVLSKDEIFGRAVRVYGYLSIMDDSQWDYFDMEWKEEYEGLNEGGPSTAFDAYESELPEGSEVFCWSVDS